MDRKIVLVDIDGTISKVGDRIRFITQQNPKDWDSFYNACFEDEPVSNIVDLVRELDETDSYDIWFCTGRRESVRTKTINWINRYVYYNEAVELLIDSALLMRKDGDKRHDTVAKPELLKEANIDLKDIAFVLEDRNSMVAKWRELGLTCLQVAEGDF